MKPALKAEGCTSWSTHSIARLLTRSKRQFRDKLVRLEGLICLFYCRGLGWSDSASEPGGRRVGPLSRVVLSVSYRWKFINTDKNVNGKVNFFLWSLSLLNVNIRLHSIWTVAGTRTLRARVNFRSSVFISAFSAFQLRGTPRHHTGELRLQVTQFRTQWGMGHLPRQFW